MRILANYGYKDNGSSYSVTFETVGDVPMEQADSTVDELFRMAKSAIQRQILNLSNDHEEAVVPQPKRNGNGSNGKLYIYNKNTQLKYKVIDK